MHEFFEGLKPITTFRGVSGVAGVSDASKPSPNGHQAQTSGRNTPCNTLSKGVNAGVLDGVAIKAEENRWSAAFETPATLETPTREILQEAYEERAAIMEFDGQLPRAEAEALAWQAVFGNIPFIRH